MNAKSKSRTFEEAIERLEEITRSMEGGELSLEESIALYSEGMELARFCREQLSVAEQKIKLVQEKSGEFTEESIGSARTSGDENG